MASSSWRTSRKPERTDWRSSVTGTSRMGARCEASARSVSVQRSSPKARNRVFAPPSSSPSRALRNRPVSVASRSSGASLTSSSRPASALRAISSQGVWPVRLRRTSDERGSLPSMISGSARRRNSLPSDSASSSAARSGAAMRSVDFDGLKLSSRLRRVRSSSFDFHFDSRPSGVSSGLASTILSSAGSSGGRSGMGSMGPAAVAAVPSVDGAVALPGVPPPSTAIDCEGRGRICTARARRMSIAYRNCPPSAR